MTAAVPKLRLTQTAPPQFLMKESRAYSLNMTVPPHFEAASRVGVSTSLGRQACIEGP